MDRQPGAYVIDKKTGELKPDLNDAAMKERCKVQGTRIEDKASDLEPGTLNLDPDSQEVTDEPGR